MCSAQHQLRHTQQHEAALAPAWNKCEHARPAGAWALHPWDAAA